MVKWHLRPDGCQQRINHRVDVGLDLCQRHATFARLFVHDFALGFDLLGCEPQLLRVAQQPQRFVFHVGDIHAKQDRDALAFTPDFRLECRLPLNLVC